LGSRFPLLTQQFNYFTKTHTHTRKRLYGGLHVACRGWGTAGRSDPLTIYDHEKTEQKNMNFLICSTLGLMTISISEYRFSAFTLSGVCRTGQHYFFLEPFHRTLHELTSCNRDCLKLKLKAQNGTIYIYKLALKHVHIYCIYTMCWEAQISIRQAK